MSQSSQINIKSPSNEARPTEVLPIINEEQGSSVQLDSGLTAEQIQKICICKNCFTTCHPEQARIAPSHVEGILKEKENELREEYERILEREKDLIKERFDLILLNEQVRASYMLREAHRERQEKIHALQTQLQCKNLAALMYVMCTERRRSRLEKLKIIEDYTKYINELHDILTRGQQLILHLSRGYKTAARVDHEWREKMKKVVHEFMAFIYHFAGGDPETNQYLIDLPKLLKTQTSTELDPEEDPCDCDDDDIAVEDTIPAEEKPWWGNLDGEERPFVMYGDMADFNPDRRREVLKQIKAQRAKPAKTAPKEWKELAVNEMFLKSNCARLDKIKNIYPDKLPVPIKWDCVHSPFGEMKLNNSRLSIPTNAARAASIDIRGTMGSILKIIAAPTTAPVPAKTELLGARDSMEITSTTRLRNSSKPDKESELSQSEPVRHETVVVLNIGKKRASVFTGQDWESDSAVEQPPGSTPPSLSNAQAEESKDDTQSILGSVHQDSLQVIQTHQQEKDHSINYERVCPMEKCQRMQVDSFMRSLPPYMRANPFMHFEQTFDQYETCTTEQLEMIKQRIEDKKTKGSEEENDNGDLDSLLSEWMSTGVGVQTSDLNMLPPCTCQEDSLKSSMDGKFVFDLADLEPVKIAMDAIHRECLFNDKIEFDRFKVIGQDMEDGERKRQKKEVDFKQTRYQEITEILNKHPSLLDIFQANAQ